MQSAACSDWLRDVISHSGSTCSWYQLEREALTLWLQHYLLLLPSILNKGRLVSICHSWCLDNPNYSPLSFLSRHNYQLVIAPACPVPATSSIQSSVSQQLEQPWLGKNITERVRSAVSLSSILTVRSEDERTLGSISILTLTYRASSREEVHIAVYISTINQYNNLRLYLSLFTNQF